STSSGSNMIDSAAGASSTSGSRTTTPSSVYMVWTSRPRRSRTRASMAWDQGAWTWAPKGEWTQTRQSPSSSRKRSTTSGRASGRAPGGVALGREARVNTHPPVAELVAEAFDHDRAVVGQDPGGLALLVQVGGQGLGGEVVEAGGPGRLGAGAR